MLLSSTIESEPLDSMLFSKKVDECVLNDKYKIYARFDYIFISLKFLLLLITISENKEEKKKNNSSSPNCNH